MESVLGGIILSFEETKKFSIIQYEFVEKILLRFDDKQTK